MVPGIEKDALLVLGLPLKRFLGIFLREVALTYRPVNLFRPVMLGRGIKDLAEFPQVRLEDAAPGVEGFLAYPSRLNLLSTQSLRPGSLELPDRHSASARH